MLKQYSKLVQFVASASAVWTGCKFATVHVPWQESRVWTMFHTRKCLNCWRCQNSL